MKRRDVLKGGLFAGLVGCFAKESKGKIEIDIPNDVNLNGNSKIGWLDTALFSSGTLNCSFENHYGIVVNGSGSIVSVTEFL